jgi:hypothetical protein
MPQKASRAFGLRRQSDAIHVFCWKRQTDADVRANCQATSLGNETFSAHHVDIVCSCSYAHHVDIVCLLELRRVTKLRAAWIQHSTTEVVNAYCILHIGAVYHTASSHFSVLTSLTKLTAASSRHVLCAKWGWNRPLYLSIATCFQRCGKALRMASFPSSWHDGTAFDVRQSPRMTSGSDGDLPGD